MKFHKLCAVILACSIILGGSAVPAGAAPSDNEAIMPYVFGSLNHRILSKNIMNLGSKFSLNKGDKVSFDCDYVPVSASVDFGVIAPDGKFYSLNSTSGSIHRSIEVNQRGQYLIAIRNNSSDDVTVAGEVNY